MKEIIKQAPSVEEALELALAELGLTSDEVEWEVLEMPKKSFIFKKPAKVLVRQREDEFDVKSLLLSADRPAAKEEKQPEKKPEKKADRQEKKAEKPKKEKKNALEAFEAQSETQAAAAEAAAESDGHCHAPDNRQCEQASRRSHQQASGLCTKRQVPGDAVGHCSRREEGV